MNILAIDSTGMVSGVSVVTEEKVLGEISTNNKKTHAETLAPMIKNLLDLLNLEMSEIDYIACGSGPGSFTGLRIGAAVAKGISQGLNIPIIPIPTLDSLAFNVFDKKSIIVPIMDARRNQVYTASYKYENNSLKKLSDYRAEDIDVLLNEMRNLDETVIFLGDGVKVFSDKILNFSEKFSITPDNNNVQRASSVGLLALENLDKAVNFKDFVPFYLRLSQAERELMEKKNV